MMLHIFLVVPILFCLVQMVSSDIVTGELPKFMAKCSAKQYDAQHSCVMDIYNNITSLVKSKDNHIQLRLQQHFYWHPIKRVRSECRTLSETERNELWDAINALKNDKSKTPNVYDWFANVHTDRALHSVHFGPNFFGWHRGYILKFEELLRKKNPNVTLCYWDSRLDDAMPRPPLSVMFSPAFFGNPWGRVRTGPFANWKTIHGVHLKRDLGAQGSFISYSGIDRILSKQSHFDISEPTAEEGYILEGMHNNIHACIGGQMNGFETSTQEPCFWFHHSFIDSVWEKFCDQMRKRGHRPEDDYVTQWITHMQKPEKYMPRLKPWRNIDGYSQYFTKNIYEYEDWPDCKNNCGDSGYLECHKSLYCRSKGKYSSKIKKNNKPRKYKNHLSKPLSDSKILSGIERINNWVFIPIKIIFRKAIKRWLINKPIVGCEEVTSKRCTEAVVLVNSIGLAYNGTYTNYVSCDVTIPVWTYAFVAVRNPALGQSQSFVSVTDKEGKPCMPLCLTKDEEKYQICTGVVNVTSSEPRIYANTLDTATKDDYIFDPISTDTIDKRVKLKFLCK